MKQIIASALVILAVIAARFLPNSQEAREGGSHVVSAKELPSAPVCVPPPKDPEGGEPGGG